MHFNMTTLRESCDIECHAVSAFDGRDGSRVGRPEVSDGHVVMRHRSWGLPVIPFTTSTSRMCAVVSNSNNLKLLLIVCLYIPNDDDCDVTHQLCMAIF